VCEGCPSGFWLKSLPVPVPAPDLGSQLTKFQNLRGGEVYWGRGTGTGRGQNREVHQCAIADCTISDVSAILRPLRRAEHISPSSETISVGRESEETWIVAPCWGS
jgi:hypothetical protein